LHDGSSLKGRQNRGREASGGLNAAAAAALAARVPPDSEHGNVLAPSGLERCNNEQTFFSYTVDERVSGLPLGGGEEPIDVPVRLLRASNPHQALVVTLACWPLEPLACTASLRIKRELTLRGRIKGVVTYMVPLII